MRIFVLSQEDAFYVPRILDHLLVSRRDVVGVGIVPGELHQGNVGRYLRMMGPLEFALQALNLLRHRVLDLLARALPTGRSWSVTGAARRERVHCENVPRVDAPDFLERLRRQGVDLVVSIACPQKFGRELLALPKHGCINIHGALLPRYQGLLPSFWVLAKGESETGVTVHWMSADIDRGDLLLQERVPIEPRDTVHTLVTRSKVGVGRHLLVQAIELIERGAAPRVPMDSSSASYFSYPDAAAVREFRARGRRFI